MKCLIIYTSKHKGNTKKVALEMADELKCEAKTVEDVNPSELDNYELIGIGSGIYAFGMDKKLKKLFKKVSQQKSKKVFLFSTSGDLNGIKYHKSMKKFLEKKGFAIIGEFNCPGAYTGWFFGKKNINIDRPSKVDLEKAREFVKEIIKKF
ncbi:MAG: flavodoxin domain-containing protein [Fervidobacterium sp.]